MYVETSGREDAALSGDGFGARANNDIDTRLHIWVPGFAYPNNLTVFNANIRFNDAPVVQDQRVGDHRIDGAAFACHL